MKERRPKRGDRVRVSLLVHKGGELFVRVRYAATVLSVDRRPRLVFVELASDGSHRWVPESRTKVL